MFYTLDLLKQPYCGSPSSVLFFLAPTLGGVLFTLFNVGDSLQEVTMHRLQETVKTVARSTAINWS